MDNLEVADLSDPIQLGVDEFVIPKGAKNKENAEKFLNFLLDAENMAESEHGRACLPVKGPDCRNQP